MKIEEILRNKGHDVVTITATHTVLAAAQALVEHNIGGLVVMDDQHPSGILTERDILRVTAQSPGELGSIEVGEMPNWIAFTPDSRFVYVTNQEDEVANGYVTVIDTTTLSIVSRIEVGQKPKRIHVVEVGRG